MPLTQQRNSSRVRFSLHPGEVISVNDGDRHYIGAAQLAQLYGVDPQECIVIDGPSHRSGYSKQYLDSLINLYPCRHYEDYERAYQQLMIYRPMPVIGERVVFAYRGLAQVIAVNLVTGYITCELDSGKLITVWPGHKQELVYRIGKRVVIDDPPFIRRI